MTPPVPAKNTAAFHIQAVISFAVSSISMAVGIVYLPMGGWPRAFLGLGLLYVITSAFTLAKTIRDQQESSSVVSRVEQARLEKFLIDRDPLAP
jgi:hypothetical protein